LEKHKDICFEIIGDGQEKDKIIKLKESLKLENVNFAGNMPLVGLADKISTADVALGIFGDTKKAKRVIPNKVYEYVAMRKPIITADTPAMRELFDNNEIFFVEISNPQKIAEAILLVKSDITNAEMFAERAYNKFIKNVLPEKIGLELKGIIQELV
jgi:glycosyltransferase involved in cell wall biosynthesis